MKKKYFLGANSSSGFYSAFGECYSAHEGWKAYIIKGGPGTGKSSFMKYFAAKAAENGLEPELCVCSSDPQSLDGVIIRSIKTVILDGTAPHVVEPRFPGVCEQILNFGDFWDAGKLDGKAEEIIAVTEHNKSLHLMASRYIHAAGQLMTDSYKIAAACTDARKLSAFAAALCRRHIPAKSGEGREWVRFIEGITPLGVVGYPGTVSAAAKTVIPISDEFGSASSVIMDAVRKNALESGYEIITLKNPFLPETITDHVIIPELSLAFVRETRYIHFETNERRIHARRFVNSKQLHGSRKRLHFNAKVTQQLFLSAAQVLSEAKSVHDDIEKYYIHAMNFGKLTRFAERFCTKSLSGMV